jgi:hypothetical protein
METVMNENQGVGFADHILLVCMFQSFTVGSGSIKVDRRSSR